MEFSLAEDNGKILLQSGTVYQGKLPSSQTSNNVSCAYEEYLVLLQKRNKLLRKLKKKSKNEIDLERKEQGFSLYLNGANVDSGKEKPCSRQKCYPTIESSPETSPADCKESGGSSRASRRRKWQLGDESRSGSCCKVSDEGSPNMSIDSQDESSSSNLLMKDNRTSSVENRPQRPLWRDYRNNPECADDMPEQLRLSFNDLKTLRRKLEDNSEIQQSITEDVSDKENEKAVCSEDEVSDVKDEVYDERCVSPQKKKLLSDTMSPKHLKRKGNRRASSSFLPDDIIVLELSPSLASPLKNKDSSFPNNFVNYKCSHCDEISTVAVNQQSFSSLSSAKQDECNVQMNNMNDKHADEMRESDQLDDDVITNVIGHVLNMAPRQQRSLLKALGILEQSAEKCLTEDPASSSSEKSWTTSTQPKFIQGTKQTPRNFEGEESFAKENQNISFPGFNQRLSSYSNQGVTSDMDHKQDRLGTVDNIVESKDGNFKSVVVRILSNWGHSTRVGLTEVQFIDELGKIKDLDPYADLCCQNVSGQRGQLLNLINGRTKTVKEKYMWSCNMSASKPVELEFRLRSTGTSSLIHNVVVWNYNKSIKDLNICARTIEILVGGVKVYGGELDKGCGNQVFDYSQVIHLGSPIITPTNYNANQNEPSNRLRGDSVQHSIASPFSSSDHSSSISSISHSRTYPSDPVPRSSFNLPFKVTSPRKSGRRNLSARSSVDSLDLSDELKQSAGNSEKLGSLEWLNTAGRPNSQIKPTIQSKTQGWFPGNELTGFMSNLSRNKPLDGWTKPSWLDNDDKHPSRNSNESKPLWLADASSSEYDPFEDSPSNQSTGGTVKKPSLLSAFNHDSDLDLSASLPPVPHRKDTDVKKQSAREGSAKYGRRSKAHSAVTACSPSSSEDMNAVIRRRDSDSSALWGNHDSCLEVGWTSLHKFDQHHRGQLIDFVNCDSLDLYKKSMREDEPRSNFSPSNNTDENVNHSDYDFIIPELPSGKHLIVNILTTWGDKHYVGLNGIELFCCTGKQINVAKIWAKPADINVLSEYKNDPRVVSNLIDGINCTRDDMHLWLAPFTPTQSHLIHMLFDKPAQIAMIRVWNYNKSRIHSFRGAKDIEIQLDNAVIFKGEIAKASGDVQGYSESFGDTILFTTDEDILEAIALNDNSFVDSAIEEFYVDEMEAPIIDRPSTGDSSASFRPYTAAGCRTNDGSDTKIMHHTDIIQTTELEIMLTSTWGESGCIGLTGLEIIGEDEEAMPLTSNMISLINPAASSKSSSVSMSRLIDETYVTMSEDHMWTAEYDPNKPCSIIIQFESLACIAGIRLWNYNAGAEASYRGVQSVILKAENCIIPPPTSHGFLVRRAPGNCFFDFAQELSFSPLPFYSPLTIDCPSSGTIHPGSKLSMIEDSSLPQGFIFQLQLLSTWGDQYYIGLNGLQVFDAFGKLIPLEENNISAYPSSVNILDGIVDDVRTPDKLIDGIHTSEDSQNSWLAPVLPNIVNRIFIIFDLPVSLSMIKLWNYSKAPNRGVREFGLLVDDFLIYNGALEQFSPTKRSYNTIMFSSSKELISREKSTIIKNEDCEQDVQMTNNSIVVLRSDTNKTVNQALRPKTGVQRNIHKMKSAR